MIQVELYGVARLRAGTGRVAVEGRTVGAALRALARACPALAGEVIEPGGRAVHPAYRLSLDGARFVSDPDEPLADGAALLLLSADVGG